MKSNCIISHRSSKRFVLPLLITALATSTAVAQETQTKTDTYLFNDAHFHLTNYVQEGTDIRDFLRIMGNKVGRSMLCGIPLQQQWMHASTGDFAPT